MARFRTWIERSNPANEGFISEFSHREWQRKHDIWHIQRDLFDAAIGLGQTDAQATAKIDALFATFAADWSLYILTGNPAIVTAIQDDATLPWLDTDVSGQSIRARLINRLTV
jgi:hypothetical protein